MSSPDVEGESRATPLDSERERLRKAGYTDAEVSQILIARASQHPAGAGQRVMSNVLSSIIAVASYARGYIIGTKADFATLFSAAPPSARVKAGGSLVLKSVVVVVLGYAALQEWSQHIVYATQQAAADANFKCQTRGGCPGVATDFEYKPLSPEQVERERVRVAALYDAARRIALNSPIVKAPDGRMVHAIGIIPERDFRAMIPREGQLPNTGALPDGGSEILYITNTVASLYQLQPNWWIAADEAAK